MNVTTARKALATLEAALATARENGDETSDYEAAVAAARTDVETAEKLATLSWEKDRDTYLARTETDTYRIWRTAEGWTLTSIGFGSVTRHRTLADAKLYAAELDAVE